MKNIKQAGVKGLYLLLRSRFVLNCFPFKNQPILLLSYPRSGSSWIGKVLSTSPSVIYFREPVTQPYLTEEHGSFSLMDITENTPDYFIYKKLSDEAFSGKPCLLPGVVSSVRKFNILGRSKKRLLIKEINPKATKFYHQLYHPKIVLLLRHPAAVATSFSQQKWLGCADNQSDTNNSKAGIWEKFGASYGITMKTALNVIKECPDCSVIEFENFALNPKTEFLKLFKALNLKIPDNYDEIIKKYCHHQGEIKSPMQTERASENMIYKWKKELTKQQIKDLKKGHDFSGLDYYSGDGHWI